MTEEQKRKAKIHVFGYTESGIGDGAQRFLEDGELISFTDCVFTAKNAEFKINNRPERLIWFSQLDRIYIDDNISTFLMPEIEFSNGDKFAFFFFTPQKFFEFVKGKKFEVSICRNVFGAINLKSEVRYRILGDKKIKSDIDVQNHLDDIVQFVRRCIENDDYDQLGDLIKKSPAYELKEV